MANKQNWVPHDYQKEAIRFLLKQGAAGLFLEPGLGKTSICLATFDILRAKQLAKKMLIIAPLRPCYVVWPLEIEKWIPFEHLTYAILHGPQKEAALTTDADIHIINPEGVEWLFSQKNRPKYDILCVDESTRFKNSTTKRFKALRAHILEFNRRWILTGTPAPNGIGDLFGQVYILDLGKSLGRYITHFRMEYYFKVGYNQYEWSLQPGAFERITEKVAPLVFQLKAADYLNMPELLPLEIPVYLPAAARDLYTDVEDEFIAEIEGDELIAANAAVAGGKCRQIANGAVYLADKSWKNIHDEKLDALEDLVEELGGNPLLLLYEFDHDRQRILQRFGDIPVVSSGISPARLEAMVRDFNAGKIPILLGHPGSMGLGLNLQEACHHVCWFGITWNLEHYDQAIRRVYRQGQTSGTVFNYHIVAKDTVDERVLQVLKDKAKTQDKMLEAIKKAGRI